ncbi:nitroreductase family protein [Actinoplanes sp. NPDC051470]|uniref:nitroreductase family protein n=1 Tax=Actinoplanes sp. NPDC051470 TaxID=3157224 RepID=UPI0034372187
MDFTDLLRQRRMTRQYRQDPVPADVVRRIVGVVHRAPSAGFSQGHRIVVITDPARRARLAAIAEPWYLRHGHQSWISQAPVHLALGIREAAYHDRYQEPDKIQDDGAEIPWPVPFWWFDAGALLVLLQLAAANEGLASGFYSPAAPDELGALAEVAELPDGTMLTGVMTLGHTSDDSAARTSRLSSRRKPLDELVTWLD